MDEKERPRILFLANVPSPYRVAFFDELSASCDLTVLYQLHASAERDKQWAAPQRGQYQAVFLRGHSTDVDKAICPGVLSWLTREWDAIIICTTVPRQVPFGGITSPPCKSATFCPPPSPGRKRRIAGRSSRFRRTKCFWPWASSSPDRALTCS